MVLDVGSISLNYSLAKYREGSTVFYNAAGCYVIMPHFKRPFLQLTNKVLYRKGQADVAAKAAE